MESPDPTERVCELPYGSRLTSAGKLLFGRYRVVREIGRGGMGLVLLARDLELDTDVAIKLVPDLIVRDREGLEDLKREVLRGMALTHPNIVRTHGFERDEEMAAIIMEFVDGGNFVDLKRAHPGGCLDADKLLPWLEQLCPVLDYAHFDIQIGHRDLKPHNLMYTTIGRLKVADFGISSTLNEAGTRVTLRDQSSGTPAYMSPQQIMGDRASRLDDVYSLGATIYELLTGKPPFYQGQVLAQVLDCVPEPMTARREALGVTGKEPIPQVWEETVAACLAKDAASRPQSAGEVLARLTGFYQVAVEPLSVPPGNAGRKARWITALVGVAALAGLGLMLLQKRQHEPAKEAVPKVLPELLVIDPLNQVELPETPVPPPDPPRITTPDVLPEARVGEAYHLSLGAEGGSPPYAWTSDGTILPDGLVLDETGLIHGIPLMASRSGFGLKVTGSDGQVSRKVVSLAIVGKPAPPVEAAVAEVVPVPDPVVQMILATKEEPFVNSLGMEFVPAGSPEVLFSRFLTRVMDFRSFVNATGYDATKGVMSVEDGGKYGFSALGKSWEDPGFVQDEDDPVCGVSWQDATAFCKWLTACERKSGELDEAFEYRLPTDAEWQASLGIKRQQGESLRYPWGNAWPPPLMRGNLAGSELKDGGATPIDWPKMAIRDNCPRTSRVDKFQPNDFGIHDFYGNLWQYCEDITNEAESRHLMRGGSWATSNPDELRIDTTVTKNRPADWRFVDAGFRCVLTRTSSR